MNKVERELALHQGILNGRHWTTLRRPDAVGFEISEITRLPVSGASAYFPGHWTGKSERAAEFALLDKAAGKRRNGACLPRYFREMRNIWFGRARQDLVLSRQKRLAATVEMEAAA